MKKKGTFFYQFYRENKNEWICVVRVGMMESCWELMKFFFCFFFVQCTPLTLTLRQSDWSGYWFDLFLWSALNCCEVKSNGEWKYYGEVWNLKSHFSMTAIMTCLSVHSSLSNHSFNWTIFSTFPSSCIVKAAH